MIQPLAFVQAELSQLVEERGVLTRLPALSSGASTEEYRYGDSNPGFRPENLPLRSRLRPTQAGSVQIAQLSSIQFGGVGDIFRDMEFWRPGLAPAYP